MENLIFENEKWRIGKQVYSGDISIESFFDSAGYNRKELIYPNGYRRVVLCNNPRFKIKSAYRKAVKDEYSLEESPDQSDTPDTGSDCSEFEERPRSTVEGIRTDNLRRIELTVEDILLLNDDLRYFVTFTFDPDKIDSTNVDKVMSKLSRWLSNQTQRRGLKYLVIPEYHPQKDEHRVHLHGLINDVLDVVDSGTRLIYGRKKPMRLPKVIRLGLESQVKSIVYNIPDWKYGWSTAIPVYGSRLQIARYITKYIGKAFADEGKIFGRAYWSSRNVIRSPEIRLIDDGGLSYQSSNLKRYDTGFGDSYKYQHDLGDVNADEKLVDELFKGVFPEKLPPSVDGSLLSKLHAIEDAKLYKRLNEEREYEERARQLLRKREEDLKARKLLADQRRRERKEAQLIKEEEERRQIKIDGL